MHLDTQKKYHCGR